ncbi:hypothetical protein A1D23_13330 [Chelonobacter oris]|nr:hypothetical protein [Chelonobacter oris]
MIKNNSGLIRRTGSLSPYINQQIKALTEGNEKANITAHALWGAIAAQASGNNALAGATAAASGELTAKLLTEQLYGKAAQDLSAEEKETISSLSQVVGALSAAAMANNGTDAYQGAEVAKSAVENNLFRYVEENPEVANNMFVLSKANSVSKKIEEKVLEELPDRTIPHYMIIEGVLYKYPIKVAVNTRTADIFTGVGMNPLTAPTSGLSMSAQIGWITNLDKYELGNNLGATINKTLEGGSIGGSLCYSFVCSSFSKTIVINGNSKYLLSVGAGGGVSVSSDYLYKVTGRDSNESN